MKRFSQNTETISEDQAEQMAGNSTQALVKAIDDAINELNSSVPFYAIIAGISAVSSMLGPLTQVNKSLVGLTLKEKVATLLPAYGARLINYPITGAEVGLTGLNIISDVAKAKDPLRTDRYKIRQVQKAIDDMKKTTQDLNKQKAILQDVRSDPWGSLHPAISGSQLTESSYEKTFLAATALHSQITKILDVLTYIPFPQISTAAFTIASLWKAATPKNVETGAYMIENWSNKAEADKFEESADETFKLSPNKIQNLDDSKPKSETYLRVQVLVSEPMKAPKGEWKMKIIGALLNDYKGNELYFKNIGEKVKGYTLKQIDKGEGSEANNVIIDSFEYENSPSILVYLTILTPNNNQVKISYDVVNMKPKSTQSILDFDDSPISKAVNYFIKEYTKKRKGSITLPQIINFIEQSPVGRLDYMTNPKNSNYSKFLSTLSLGLEIHNSQQAKGKQLPAKPRIQQILDDTNLESPRSRTLLNLMADQYTSGILYQFLIKKNTEIISLIENEAKKTDSVFNLLPDTPLKMWFNRGGGWNHPFFRTLLSDISTLKQALRKNKRFK